MLNTDDIEILIVEDNPNDAEMALRALRKNNLSNKVHIIDDGEKALEFICNNFTNPKIILLDLKLPKISGLEVLKELKSSPKTRALPVIVLTSSQEESDIIESYNLGVNSYIVKPVDFDKFVDAIRDIGYYWLLLNKAPGQL